MSFLKNIFAKNDDNIPEMKLQKNEPIPYYHKELKCWVIPGEEEEKRKEVEASRKGPPKKKTTTANTSNTGEMSIAPNPNRPKPTAGKGKKPNMANRYASALPMENMATDNNNKIESSKGDEGKVESNNNNYVSKDKPMIFKPEKINSNNNCEDKGNNNSENLKNNNGEDMSNNMSNGNSNNIQNMEMNKRKYIDNTLFVR